MFTELRLLYGVQTYIEVPSSPEFSIASNGGLTISAWIRPETLSLSNTERSSYVHWLGKGEKEEHEWTFRMYSQDNTEGRGNRISFYAFGMSHIGFRCALSDDQRHQTTQDKTK